MFKPAQVAVLCLSALAIVSPALAGEVTAQQVFDRLKSLAGSWEGTAEGAEATEEVDALGTVTHEIALSAAGTVVMETMGPGTGHEMINMYHLDGANLLLTHYCAGGNQPQMRLNLDQSTAQQLVFDFVGGTNLDPATDQYIGGARIKIVDSDHMESIWQGYSAGEQNATMTFHLARVD